MTLPYTFRHGDRPLDGMTIQRAVGRGGFGEVYYAVTDAGKDVAIKYLRDNVDVELRGVQHVMNISSPHLVKIHDVRYSVDGEPFVVMEYVSGPSLRDVLRVEANGLVPEKAVFFARGIAQGLNDLHAAGVVHRDLKPGNIFYDEGYVKIGDYGLSKLVSLSQHSNQTVSVGTVHYMAPEIGTGSYTKLVDVYALGVVLFEMLAGRLPFIGSSIQEVLMRQLQEEADTSLIPPEFAPVVGRALAKDASERYQDVNALADALMQVGDIAERVSLFNADTLTAIPRKPADEHESPVGRVALDARAAALPAPPHSSALEPPYSDRYQVPDPESFGLPLKITIMLAVIAAFFSLAGAMSGTGGGPFVELRKLSFALGFVSGSVLMYKWWATLPAGWRRTTPVRAVGFCFIPFFNLYWFWVAFHGLLIDLNRYMTHFAPEARRLTHGWLVGYWVFFILAAATSDELGTGFVHFVMAAGMAVTGIIFTLETTETCEALARRRHKTDYGLAAATAGQV